MPRGPMGGRRAVEEPHDFGKVMGKLVNYCRNYLPVIIIALILGAAGTVCQIVGPDKLKDIWERYYKVDKEHKRAQMGSGLGLSIVKNILDMHGGTYGVTSTLGQGSTFWFELPIARQTPEGLPGPQG